MKTRRITDIVWNSRPDVWHPTGLKDRRGRSLSLDYLKFSHFEPKEAQLEFALKFEDPAVRYRFFRHQFTEGDSLSLFLNEQLMILGFEVDFEAQKKDPCDNISCRISLRSSAFSKFAVKILPELFRDVLGMDGRRLFEARMSQRTVVLMRDSENVWMPYFTHLLRTYGKG